MRLAVGVPCTDRVHTDFAFALAGITMRQTAFKQLALIKGQASISAAKARNNLVYGAKSIGATHLLMLDSDMIFPLDTIDRLAAHNVPIVGCIYRRRNEPFELMGRVEGREVTEEPLEGLVKMDLLPTGVMLVQMSVFDKIEKPWFKNDIRAYNGEMTIGGEDIIFCEEARKAGFGVWCDADLSNEVGHLCQATLTVQGMQMSSNVAGFQRVSDKSDSTRRSSQ